MLDCEAEVSVMITVTHYHRSSLVQGGLEIPCNLTANLTGYSASNHVLLQKYVEIVSDLYVEPTNEEIIGSSLIPNEGSGRANRTNSMQPGPSKKEDLLMINENCDRGLTSERYFNALKHVTGELNDNRIMTAVLLWYKNFFVTKCNFRTHRN